MIGPSNHFWEDMFDGTYKPDRCKLSELLALADGNPKHDHTEPTQVEMDARTDLFEHSPTEKFVMGIFDLLAEDWFQNLVWRLRSNVQFDTLDDFDGYHDEMLAPLKRNVERAVARDDGVSVNEAARCIDLLNNIDRFGGWDQKNKLACLCTKEQLEAYDEHWKDFEGGHVKRWKYFTRGWQHVPTLIKKQVDFLNPDNPRLRINRPHNEHYMDAGAVKDGVRKFRRHILDVFLAIYKNPLGRKMLWLALCINQKGHMSAYVKNLRIVFLQSSDHINAFLKVLT